MTVSIQILRWIVRLAGLAALIFGCILWTGRGYAWLQPHMWLGFIVTFALLALALIGFLVRLSPVLPFLSLAWAVALPVLGIAQLRIVLGPNHWTIRVLHLILGIGAIGLGEAISGRALRRQLR